MTALALAWSLRAAANTDEYHRREQTIELVWTGPVPAGTTLRRTDQALLDLIQTARRELFLVTFAAYMIPALNAAMLVAARRGVRLRLIFEGEAGKTTFAAADAVDDDLRSLASIYIWPFENRPQDAAGRYGSLHAKCAVADDATLLVSSANLTEYALLMNMEMGVLVRDGQSPSRATGHLRQLIEDGTLRAV